MRISITGSKSLVDQISSALADAGAASTERSDSHLDRTEQAFGIGEVATVVAILSGFGKLVEYLIAAKAALKKGEQQTLHVKTSLGLVAITLDRDVTAAELSRQLAAIIGQQ